jgi:GntR family transcriptional regulator
VVGQHITAHPERSWAAHLDAKVGSDITSHVMSDNGAVSGSRNKGAFSIRVAEQIRQQIAVGRYPTGSRLPPEPELAREMGVSRSTLREALKVLEHDRLITRRRRAGTVVRSRPSVKNSLHHNHGVRDLVQASGKVHGVRDAAIRFADATPLVAELLALPLGESIVTLERIRTADGEPVVLTIDHISSEIVEHAAAPLLPEVALYEWLKDCCNLEVSYGIAHVEAMLAPTDLARRLDVQPSAPIFRLEQVDYTGDGRPVLHSQEFYLADAFDITIIRQGPYA